MALIKTGQGIIDISGKIAGNVFGRDRSGLHCRSFIKRRDPRSVLQDRRRKAFSQSMNAWKSHSFSTTELSLWKNWAHRHPRKTRYGHIYELSPFLSFMHLNIYRVYNYLPISFNPPND